MHCLGSSKFTVSETKIDCPSPSCFSTRQDLLRRCEFKSRSDEVTSTSTQGVLDITLWLCQWLVAVRWFSPGTPVSSTNKSDRHDIAKILLIVALNTIILTPIRNVEFLWRTSQIIWYCIFRRERCLGFSQLELRITRGGHCLCRIKKKWEKFVENFIHPHFRLRF